MRIRKIQLENFRSHANTTLELQSLTVIRGTNAAGKSSLEQAIEIVLAGRADGTTSDGKGSVNLIRAGATKAAITMAVQHEGDERILKCALNGTSRAVIVSKPGDPQYSGGQEFLDYLGMHRAVLSCLINNRHFVDLDEKSQKDILASIILPKQYAWPEWVQPACFEAGLKVNWARTPFEIIDQAYTAAFDLRRDVNRDIKNFQMPAGSDEGWDQVQEIEAALGERKGWLEDARKRRQQMTAEDSSRESRRNAATERLSAAKSRAQREEQAVTAAEQGLLSAAKLKEVKKTAENEKKAAKLDADLIALDTQITEKKKAQSVINKLSAEPKCPTCASPITEDLIATLAGPLIAESNKLSEDRQNLIDQRKALGNPEEAKALLEKHARADIDMKRAKERIAEENTVIRDAEAELDRLGKPQAVATAEIDAEIADLSARVERGTQALMDVRSAASLHKSIEDARNRRQKLEAQQGQLERLVKYFGADGVKAELLASTIGDFTQKMNEVLANWGYQCQLLMEPYSLSFGFKGAEVRHTINLRNLSKSQRYRFATALQVALAVVSGFRFVIADEADLYDQAGRSGLFEALTTGVLDQAIVLGTDQRTEVPEVDGAVFYMFENSADADQIPATKVTRLLPKREVAA